MSVEIVFTIATCALTRVSIEVMAHVHRVLHRVHFATIHKQNFTLVSISHLES